MNCAIGAHIRKQLTMYSNQRHLVLGLAASFAGAASAAPLVYEVEGVLTEAENLAFAVINGQLLSSAPEAGDLPLGFTGTFTIDTAGGFAALSFEGSFASPTRSYTFDVTTPNVIDGLSVLALAGPVEFDDVFDGFDFETAFTSNAGVGTFRYRVPNGVPSDPPRDIVAEGVFTDIRLADSPANPADLAPPFGVLDLRDISAFVDGFLAGDGITDLNEDGVLDLSDVTLFVDAFTHGLP